MTTVHEAWASVMGDVQAIRKGERNAAQGFNFRGIDAVVNAVGPALRKHGATVVPTAESIETERYQTAKGGLMQGVICRVRFTVYGPEGDSFEGSAYGQAADSGDKAVSKAHSVAYRTFLLQALCVPTDDPEPDSQAHERAPYREPVRQDSRAKAGIAGDWPTPAVPPDKPLTDTTRKQLFALMGERGVSEPDAQRAAMSKVLGRAVESRSSLTEAEALRLIASLRGQA